MWFAVLRRWSFHLAAALSLLLCLVFAALWARSLGHFEIVNWRYNRWLQADDVQCYSGFLAWQSNTLRIEVSSMPMGPESFAWMTPPDRQYFRKEQPPGAEWSFLGEPWTLEMNGYSPGFCARHYPFPMSGIAGDRYVLAVRPWLPTLLAAILPFVWLIIYRRRHGVLWKFGLRELLLSVTTFAVLLGVGLWLMR